MSHSHPTAASSSPSSSNFQLIFNNALKAYQQRTKKNLLSHPLAAQLQTCESPSDILAVLQQQVGGLDQSQSGDDRWTKWLDPTINVLLAFSDSGSGCWPGMPEDMRFYEICPHIYLAGLFTSDGDLCGDWRSSFSVYSSYLGVGVL